MIHIDKGTRVVLVALGIHLAIVLPLASALNLWVDESYTIGTISGSLAHTLERAAKFELQPPLYFLLMNLWGRLGTSVFFLRLFSVLSMVLAVVVISRLSKKMFPEFPPGWAALIAAVNPFAVWASTEMRLYAFLVLLSAMILWTFHEGFLVATPNSRSHRTGFFVCSVLGLYTQYYAAFLLAALFVGLLALKRWPALKRLAAWYALTAACALPLLFNILGQAADHTKFIVPDNGPQNYLSVAVRFIRYNLRLEWAPTAVYMAIYAACLAGLLGLAVKYRRALDYRHAFSWALVVVVTAFFLVILPIVNHELVSISHTAVLFVPSLLIPVAAASLLPETIRRRGALLAAGIMIAANFIYMFSEYRPMAKLGDFRRAAAYIEENETPGEAIVVFVADMVLPLSHYYSGVNSFLPIPIAPSPTRYDIRDFALKSEADLDAAIGGGRQPPDALWVFKWTSKGYLGVDFHGEILEEYIRKYYTVEDEKSFFESTVRLLRRK